MAVEGTEAAVAVAATVAVAPADSSSSGRGRQWQRQAKTEAAVGADNNQPEIGSNSGSRNDNCGGNKDGGSWQQKNQRQ